MMDSKRISKAIITMKVSKSIVLTALIFSFSSLYGQKTNIKHNLKAEYTINDTAVSKTVFDEFLAGLKEIEKTWYCAETRNGGITGYNARDKNGVIYVYRSEQDSKYSKSSIKLSK